MANACPQCGAWRSDAAPQDPEDFCRHCRVGATLAADPNRDRRAPYMIWSHPYEDAGALTKWGPYATLAEAEKDLAAILTYPHGKHGAHIRDAYRERVVLA